MAGTVKQRVCVGMSGGVDSTMAAWLLQRDGYDVIGVTMQIWDNTVPLVDAGRSGCYGPGEVRDLESARAVAARLGIPHVVVSLADEYSRRVLEYFRAEYRAGRTPNPCVVCNQQLKFGLLLERARAQGIAFDMFATGHYARVVRSDRSGDCHLLRGVDTRKDQSYFLARLTQEQLRHVMFPLGGLTKSEVVHRARAAGFDDVAARDESQDFIESDDYTPLFGPADNLPGEIEDTTGRVLGRHRGIVRYTIGQREGLGIGGQKTPLYVVILDPAANRVVVGPVEALMRDEFEVAGCNWLVQDTAGTVTVKIRYNHKGCPATVEPLPGQRARVRTQEPQRAITPGQAAVFYRDDEVLGGGWIC